MEQEMVQQASVQLPTIIEQSPEDHPQQDHVIVELPPLARSRPNLPCSDLLHEGNRDTYIEFGIPLYEASINADWKAAKEILDKKPDLIRSSITENGETALHVAASAKRTKRVAEFVQNLVNMMEMADLELQNKSYNTALCLAAAAGNLEMVDIMVKKNMALLTIPGSNEMMPLYMASLFGEHDVVKYLFKKSKGLRDDGWNAKNRAWLLQKCVEGDMFDIALQILKDHGELASDGEVLRILAKKPDAFIEKSSNFLWRTVSWVFAFVCSKEGHPKKDTEALELLRIIWKNIVKKPKKVIDDMIRGPADMIKKDVRLPYGKEDQHLHFLKLIAEHVIKIPAEIQKINRGPTANISVTPSTTTAKKTYSLRTLFIAAEMGNTKFIVELIRQYPDLIWKNMALLTIPGSNEMMPLYMASIFGEHDVVKYLFKKSKGLRDDGWNAKNRAWLLQKCVEGDMFDIALQILKDHGELASDGEVLRILAKKPDAFVEKSSNFLWRTVSWVFAFVCSKEGHPKKDTEALELLRIIWKNIVKNPKKVIDDMIRGPADVIKKDVRLPYGKEDQHLHFLKLIAEHVIKIPTEIQKINRGPTANISVTPSMTTAKKTYSLRTLFIAAEMGNTKFIVELIRQYPDLIWKVNDNNQTIFHIAVKHRHEGIYNLLYEIGSMKDLITPLRDENDNNMLHLVGKSAKRKRLQDVSGVAFQMQRELLWFKEVESMIPPSYRERKNKDGLTPYELFTKEHRELVAKGEEWMKGTASQCMVVAALIATVVFAAAFTVPGGYNQTNGIPIFKSKQHL
ncbi:ankyrin repeat-containing domain, PGG domain protein [Artemisia annua]|uniref:Ankyrin repeat-containing domain, PGG domain protein n=1 Tax=Artemisia annua TaxID=35608 RepID=A0A2U1PWI8_ARTAN|nr:ankyrin repeat-containing domain, PGG domain protein [Artemisia annua]